ncbi:MAG: diaminopimelate decarboxylase [Succinatimonas sp.]|jgi:diaminopimelate decarboxylase|nr:diaminopimelate decarboxylase [Succinatimonas sp.]MDD5867999.1 diaminopimelate decarboxylase [Succinatimonas sp.]MDY5721848.1 diaminopimelate decarboxylase [Succinivibrio sp.]
MDYFNFKGNELFAEDLKVTELAKQFGTPLYVYSKATLTRHMHAFEDSLNGKKHLVCFAVKACSNLAVINVMAKLGAGFDIVSEGELRRVIAAGGDPKKVVYSGVGKSESEIEFALSQGINCLNIESEEEIDTVIKVAKKLNVVAPVALRVNPGVDAKTHPYISTGLKNNKFGVSEEIAFELYQKMAKESCLKISGIDCHIGSQMTSGMPIIEATDKIIALYNKLLAVGIKVDHIDMGGGLGVTYDNETPPTPSEYCAPILERLKDLDVAIYIEPGRAMVANACVLLAKVQYQKDNGDKHFVITDTGMNDMIRPALYGSWMTILNAVKHEDGETVLCDVVGPICESDDFLGKDRKLNVKNGDILAVRGAGAYGSSMSSTYNTRRLPCEIMVDGDKSYVIKKRQTYEDIWKDECILG